jgi:CheY-like chemotaxis protein
MSRTILLVEDNTDNRIIYRRALEYFGCGVLHPIAESAGEVRRL